MEVIKISNLTYYYPYSKKPAIENINLTINEGEFVLILGPSGCGKSTLLRVINGLIPNFYGGKIKGEVLIFNQNIKNISKKDLLRRVGFIFQDPEKQSVYNKIEREIAFGMENLGFELEDMRRNVAEVCALFNLSSIKYKSLDNVSGGEKQKVEIASVMAMDPDIILFDEPTSQLDPISSEEVINSIIKLNKELGKTVVLVEQRVDRCFDVFDKIIVMDKGKIAYHIRKDELYEYLDKIDFLPKVSIVFKKAGYDFIPLNVKDGRKFIANKECKFNEQKNIKKFNKKILEVENLNFEYKVGDYTLKDISFSLHQGEVLAVMGQNGAGKTTLFKIIAGIIKNFKGKVLINGKNIKDFNDKERVRKIGYLSQNPNLYFGRDTVFDEVAYSLKNIGQYNEDVVKETLRKFDLYDLMDKNPRDLSGGQKQRLAIACTVVSDPDILILDEPTRGVDIYHKEEVGNFIKEYANKGKSVIVITHDSDFVGDYCDTVILMFQGEIIALGSVEHVLVNSLYYSPQVTKLFKNIYKVVNTKEAIEILKSLKE
ncbi:energy-coupling factor transport system ATP-binding protein [Caloramator fervidus]|uniref:Energy-coupling factor transport system ATP-binding protein n=1 Tax=Caloramator fervidus TaxID=29344 RepID=A0A1H5SIX6_9CLOT|nr:energy-coupling factor transporter ATPase [Caloramator fervidus]SEF50579.1 energy-coupling factor transport system ATP-binding protein [Caloramator fervidus]